MVWKLRKNIIKPESEKRLLARISWSELPEMKTMTDEDWESLSNEIERTMRIRHAIEEILKYAQCFTGPPQVVEAEESMDLYYRLQIPRGITGRTLDDILRITVESLIFFFKGKETGLTFGVVD